MSTDTRIFLIGPMGAGKTTVGKRLAERFGLRFVDSDRDVEERTGVDIPRIFEIEGEGGFRDREANAIDRLTALPSVVVATGGGAVLREANRRHLRERGRVVYLYAPVETQWERTRHSDRPLLRAADPRARLQELLDQRDPLYRETAHVVVDTRVESANAVVERLVEQLSEPRS